MMMVKSLWWHMLVCPTIKWKPNTTHMKGSALQLFGLFHHSDVIFMVAHSFDYWSLAFEIPYGIKSIHKKVKPCGHLSCKNMILI